jgi:hypothetical protein
MLLQSAILFAVVLVAVCFLGKCFCGFHRELNSHHECCYSFLLLQSASEMQSPPSPKQNLGNGDQAHGRNPMARSGRAAAVVAAVLLANGTAAKAQTSQPGDTEVQQLRELVLKLQSRIEQLEKRQAVDSSAGSDTQAQFSGASVPSAPSSSTVSKEDAGSLEFLKGTTISGALDGYYGYNFNQPIARVNLLRAYDVMSNSFSLNQANFLLEHAANPAAGNRFGVRLDFQYGQATETVQGSASNELRPQVYRPLWQAYGTYVFPVGSGLTVDFGKFASSLGVEGNYGKDQINYSRSYYFDFLPFYHMGFRAGYNLSPKVNLTYWLVNGAQQTEDFNGFKSQAFITTLKPTGTVTWNVNYYFGQEQRAVNAMLNPGLPTGPTQPGLPTTNIVPVPNGREHIFDSYVTWNATPRLTLVGEGDYVVNRLFTNSAPQHVSGGAAYARYQLTPKSAIAGRGEYLSDRGGLFSGITQALKETTFTYEYRFADGFLARTEWRRDFSNQPFFLTELPSVLKKEQNTATLGLIWWFGGKQGSW